MPVERVWRWGSATVASIGLFCATAAWADWGAIAISDQTGRYGYSYNQQNQHAAESRALRKCGVPDCAIEVTVQNACGAVAGGGGYIGAAYADTRAEAEEDALDACGNSECDILAWNCS